MSVSVFPCGIVSQKGLCCMKRLTFLVLSVSLAFGAWLAVAPDLDAGCRGSKGRGIFRLFHRQHGGHGLLGLRGGCR